MPFVCYWTERTRGEIVDGVGAFSKGNSHDRILCCVKETNWMSALLLQNIAFGYDEWVFSYCVRSLCWMVFRSFGKTSHFSFGIFINIGPMEIATHSPHLPGYEAYENFIFGISYRKFVCSSCPFLNESWRREKRKHSTCFFMQLIAFTSQSD